MGKKSNRLSLQVRERAVSRVQDHRSEYPPPLAAIGVNVTLMILGFMMWWKDKFPWLALPCVFMFACAASGAIPGFYWGQLIGNVGEPIFNIGLIAAGFKYAGLPKPAAASVAAPA